MKEVRGKSGGSAILDHIAKRTYKKKLNDGKVTYWNPSMIRLDQSMLPITVKMSSCIQTEEKSLIQRRNMM